MNDRKNILIVAQTPPPVGGQAAATEDLLHSRFTECFNVDHVRMNYSHHVGARGKFQISKLLELVRILLSVTQICLRKEIEWIYYLPAPSRICLYRDAVTILLFRILSKRYVLHFHASGLRAFHQRLYPFEKWLFSCTVGDADAVIVLGERFRKDWSEFFPHSQMFVVPSGIQDANARGYARAEETTPKTHILFLSILLEAKGPFLVLEAFDKIVHTHQRNAHLTIAGPFPSREIQDRLSQYIDDHDLSDHVFLSGQVEGDKKWALYRQADIFVFPTFFPQESLSAVLFEAMCMGIPIVTTDWAAIPEAVLDGVNGFIVPVKNVDMLVEKLLVLIDNADLRAKMGTAGRKRFLENYTLERFESRMIEVFNQLSR